MRDLNSEDDILKFDSPPVHATHWRIAWQPLSNLIQLLAISSSHNWKVFFPHVMLGGGSNMFFYVHPYKGR